MKLKKRNVLSAAILIFFTMVAISLQTIVFETERIIIDNTMSKDDLKRLQESIKDKGISLTFSEINYSSEGTIESLKGCVKNGVNFISSSGTFSASDLDKVVIVKGFLGIEIQVFSETKS